MTIDEMSRPNGDLPTPANSSGEISEASLRELGRNVDQYIRRYVVTSKISLQEVREFLFAILRTANSPTISTTHGAAACNALSAFFDWAIRKGHSDVQALVFSEATFSSGLEVYFQRADATKAKPLKQLLVSLASLISRNQSVEAQNHMKTLAVSKAVTSISYQGDISFVKSSMQVLEFMLQKSLISSCDVFAAWKDLSSASFETHLASSNDVPNRGKSPHGFIFACLEFLPYPNVASIIGRLVSSLLASLQTDSMNDTEEGTGERYDGLRWLDAMKRYLVIRPDLFDAFEENVLPALLESGTLSRNNIINTLPLQLIEHGELRSLDHSEIHLALICIRHLVRHDKGQDTREGRTMQQVANLIL